MAVEVWDPVSGMVGDRGFQEPAPVSDLAHQMLPVRLARILGQEWAQHIRTARSEHRAALPARVNRAEREQVRATAVQELRAREDL
jgi:hypothetical protein